MKKVIRTVLWILTIFFALSALVYFPSFFSLFAFFIVALIIPIQRWHKFLNKYIKSGIRVITVIALAIICIITVPSNDTSSDMNPPANTSTKAEINKPVNDPSIQPPHIHSFSAATCTMPKTCTDCGATEGSTTEHTWKTATCTSPKTCTICGVTEGNVNGHNWKSATCSAPKTCTVCGVTEGNANEHNWKSATCSAPKTCTVCGVQEGAASGHIYANGTCSECGAKDPSANSISYILNVSTKKFHHTSCSRLPAKNRQDTTMTRAEVVAEGYSPCGYCNP